MHNNFFNRNLIIFAKRLIYVIILKIRDCLLYQNLFFYLKTSIMRKIMLLLISALLLGAIPAVNAQVNLFSAQNQSDLRGKSMPQAGMQVKALFSTVTCDNPNYAPGATFDLVFHYNHSSPDEEWVDGISLDFPSGVTVNSATEFSGVGGLIDWNGETGNGVLVTWGDIVGGSELGDIAGNASTSVNVTVDPAFSGDLMIDWFVAGDEWGEPPHQVAGTITLQEASDHDLGVVDVFPKLADAGTSVFPSVFVSNFGLVTADEFSLHLVINDGVTDIYDEAYNITDAGLEYGQTHEFFMPVQWQNIQSGEYTITATVNLTGDTNPANDQMVVECISMFAVSSYVINASQGHFAKLEIPSGDETVINSISVDNFPMAMEYAEGTYYFIRNSPAQLYTINPETGVSTLVANITGITGTPTGIAYDWGSGIMYIVFLNASNNPVLGTLNLNTGAATSIGTGTGMVIAMDFDENNELYGVTIDNDELVHINKSTGAITVIGPIGMDANFGQDISFDLYSNTMYGMLYGSAPGLYTINLQTGAAEMVFSYSDQYAAFAIPFEAGPVVMSRLPSPNSVGVELDAEVSATFMQNIFEVDLSGVTINPDPGNVVATIDGMTLNIAHDDFAYNTVYTVTIPEGSITDGEEELQSDVIWSFTTKLDPAGCNPPSNIYVVDVNYNEVTIDWTETGAAESWNVLYGFSGFDPLSQGILLLAEEKPFLITGLQDNTPYDVYVQALCAGSQESDWTGPFSFSTPQDCSSAITFFPFSENFNDPLFPPNCWTTIDYHSHPNCNWHHNFDGNEGYAQVLYEDMQLMDEWLISPTFDFTGVVPATFSFSFMASYHWMVQEQGADIMLKVSTDGGVNWNQIWREEDFGEFENFQWYNVTLPLEAYAGVSNFRFAFHFYGDDGAQTGIDNIVIDIVVKENILTESNVSVYPNPSSGLVYIEVEEASIVRVYDIAGRIIETQKLNGRETMNFTQSKGLYIIQVETNGKISNHRVIIN